MATQTLPADVRPAKITRTSSIVNPVISRRGLIGGAGLSTIAMAVPAIATALPLRLDDRADWTALVAEYRARQADYTAASARQDEAEEAYMEDRPARPMFMIEIEGDYGRFGKHVLPVTLMHDEVDDLTRSWKDPQQIAGFRARLAEYRAADEAAKVRHGVRAAADAARAAGDAEIAAYDRVMAFPACDAMMLAEKLEILAPEYSEDAAAWATVLTDAKRVARSEARA